MTAAAATLPGRLRLKTARDFRDAYRRGARASADWVSVVVFRRRGDAQLGPRLGVSVSKDHGGAVRRNKIKRLLREAFRLERHRLPADVDVVLIPRRRDEDFPLLALRDEVPRLVEKALRKAKGAPPRRRRQP